jgi:hypothetical protein
MGTPPVSVHQPPQQSFTHTLAPPTSNWLEPHRSSFAMRAISDIDTDYLQP